jgi:hypothetical protein
MNQQSNEIEKENEIITFNKSLISMFISLTCFAVILWILINNLALKIIIILILNSFLLFLDYRPLILTRDFFSYKPLWRRKIIIPLSSVTSVEIIKPVLNRQLAYYINIKYLDRNRKKNFKYFFDNYESCIKAKNYLGKRNIKCEYDV